MDYRIMRIDPRSVTPESVTFAADVLTINLPQRTYVQGSPYFIRLVDALPDDTTIGAQVVLTVGAGTVTYPLVDRCGVQVTAERLRSGYSYPVSVVSGGANGAFRLLAPICYSRYGMAFAIDGTDAAAAGGGDGA